MNQNQIYIKKIDIYFDYRYEKFDFILNKNILKYKLKFVIRQIFEFNNKNIYLLQFSIFIREILKLNIYNRVYFVNFALLSCFLIFFLFLLISLIFIIIYIDFL